MTYDKAFKEEAVALSDDIGLKRAAEQLGIPYHTLSDWRHYRKKFGDVSYVGHGKYAVPVSEKDRRIKDLEKELLEAKRANVILQEALGFFAASRKK